MRSKFFVAAVLVFLPLGALPGSPAQGQVPPVGPSGPVWRVSSVYFNPASPMVGQYYTFNVVVYSATPVLTKVEIVSVPPGDVLQGNAVQQVTAGPGERTFSFTIYCVAPTGTVQYKAAPLKAQ